MSFHIVNEGREVNKRYRLARRTVCFKLGDIPKNTSDPEKWLKKVIEGIVKHITSEVHSEDKLGFTFGSGCFYRGDAYISFTKAKDLKFEDIWGLLGKIYQSNSEGIHSDTFRITMTQLRPYKGMGRRRAGYNNFEEECSSRRGIVCVFNNDSLCLLRAIVVGKAYASRSPYTKQIRNNTGNMQDEEVKKLMRVVQISESGGGAEELKKIQDHLQDFKITVYAYGTKGRSVLFEGPDAPVEINLIHHDNHYNVITNLKSAFACSYYCKACHVPFEKKDEHRCLSTCPCCCQRPSCEKVKEEIPCSICHRKFRGLECYEKHKADICQNIRKCTECLKTIKSDRAHICNEVYCKICLKHQPADHHCYIVPDVKKPPSKDFLLVFYDLESRQELSEDVKKHIPNLCVFQQRCDMCINKDIIVCQKCCIRQQVLKINPVQRFVSYILGVRRIFKKIVVIAHNGKAYDHQFLLKHVLEKVDIKVDLIMRGSSIIMMRIDNVKFIDSISYFPMPLSALTKSFGLAPELKKGYFPHLFNTVTNSDYDGLLPDLKYYAPDTMNEDARLSFLEWHKEHRSENFNMNRDLAAYCISDVDILTKACLKFRKEMLTECNVCPFLEAVTIASACNLIYRRNFLKPETIGIVPRNLYKNVGNQSKIATMWLIYEESQRNIEILHSAKQREVLLDGVRVDGFCEKTEQVFEFNGCYWHGHTCISERRDDPLHEDPTDTLNNRYQRTIKKMERLRSRGYEIIEMWECHFREMLNGQLKQELENHPIMATTPLNPRDAFFGGRTGNCNTYYQTKHGEKIKYVDVCSLYPWVCKNGKFPVAHPKIHIGDACKELDLYQVEGLVKCKVLAPQQLYHAVLPTKMNKKLMFVLCRTCGLTLNQEECTHSEDERALTGTWVIDEIRKALDVGYIVLAVYEVWQYNVQQYDVSSKSGGLFAEMMNKFLKLKQEATGWPINCDSEEDRKAYLKTFYETEGIQLDPTKISKNAGARSLAKLSLNSFWGKFGQRQNQPETSIIRQPFELDQLVSNPSIKINHMEEITEETLIVNWERLDEAAEQIPTINVVVAAYTTAQARLKLYSYLELLGEKTLYYDTDSVIYVHREGEWEVPTGSCLGDMTNELEEYGIDSYIVVFASGGPKNYSYIVFSPKYNTYFSVCKVKGIRLNYDATKLINFYSMSEMITSELPVAPIPVNFTSIRRTRKHEVITVDERKLYSIRSEKRKFDDTFDSVPYGFKKPKLD